MAKYRLSVDKTINSMDFIEIQTDLTDMELDALLNKIEKDDITTTDEYIKKLQAQGIKINDVVWNDNTYYRKAEVIETEQIKEPTVFEFLTELKSQVTDEEFKIILSATDADIKFNRVGFGKKTSPEQYINICKCCASLILGRGKI